MEGGELTDLDADLIALKEVLEEGKEVSLGEVCEVTGYDFGMYLLASSYRNDDQGVVETHHLALADAYKKTLMGRIFADHEVMQDVLGNQLLEYHSHQKDYPLVAQSHEPVEESQDEAEVEIPYIY